LAVLLFCAVVCVVALLSKPVAPAWRPDAATEEQR
jgi:hypothetical protein